MISIKDKVFSVDIDGKKIILESASGKYFELNSTAATLYDLLKSGPKDIDEIVKGYEELYGHGTADYAKEVNQLVESSSIFFFLENED